MNRVTRWIGMFGLLFAGVTAAIGQTTSITVFAEDFEGDFPGSSWQVGDTDGDYGLTYWGDVNTGFGGIAPHGGNWKGYCAGVGYDGTAASPLYQNHMKAYMRRTVDLSNDSTASLTFASYIAGIESGYDFCRVYATGKSKALTKLWEQSPATADTAWTAQTVSLNNFVGTGQTSVVIQFEFDSDGTFTSQGWYLDDIALSAQPAPVDLLLTNLVVLPTYLKKGATPTAVTFGAGLTAKSGAINGRTVTVNFYLASGATTNGASLIGSVPVTLTIPPGTNVTVKLTASQLAGIVIPASFGGNGYVVASLQHPSDDPNANNDWAATPVRVDDYADTLPNATLIATNTPVSGTIDDATDLDDMQVVLAAGSQYAVTTTLGTLSGAVTTLYAADQVTPLSCVTNSRAGSAGTNAISYCTAAGTCYIQVAGLHGATGTYTVAVQAQRVDLGLANLVIAPSYLKQGAGPTAVRFGVSLSAASAPLAGHPATVNFYLSTNGVSTTKLLVGSVVMTLTNQPPPGGTVMVDLTPAQVSGLAIQATTGGSYTVTACLQHLPDDPNTNNDWTAATVLVDDYPDTLANATLIATNTAVHGTIEVASDDDDFKVALAAGHQYAVTATPGTLSGAVLTLYGPDQTTVLASGTNLMYDCTADGIYYIQLAGVPGAAGTYTLTVQAQRVDLGLANLVVAPGYLKQGAGPVAVRFGVSLSAASAPINGRPATVNFYLSTNGVINTNNPIGNVRIAVTNLPGGTAMVNLSPAQVGGLAIHAATGGTYTVFACLQHQVDDPNTNNDWTSTTVLVDDYPDTLAQATLIATNTTVQGTIEVAGDDDDFKVALPAGHQYAVTVTLGTLAGAAIRLYGPDQVTVLGTAAAAGAGSSATVSYLTPGTGSETCYIQVTGTGAATGTYAVNVQSQSVDLSLANLAFLPAYLKKGAGPTNVQFDVGLSAASAAIAGRQATVNFYLASNATAGATSTNTPIGSASVTLTIGPGGTVTVGLSPAQLAGIAMPATASGPYTAIASLQHLSDDANAANDWTSAPVLVDDYPDTFAEAWPIAVDTDVPGTIEDAYDIDDFQVPLSSDFVYVITLAPGPGAPPLTNAVLRLYGHDQSTLVAVSSNDFAEGLDARITCAPGTNVQYGLVTNVTWEWVVTVTNLPTGPFTNSPVWTPISKVTTGLVENSGTYYIQVTGANQSSGAYTLHVRKVPPVDPGSEADVEAIDVSLELASGDVRGQHPISVTYALRNNSLTNPIVNGYYIVDFHLTNSVLGTDRLIGHSEVAVSIDVQQTVELSVPTDQLGWTIIPADLSPTNYAVVMHVSPVPTLAPSDPDDDNNWVTGNTIASPGVPIISGKVTQFGTGAGVSNVVLTFTDDSGAFTNSAIADPNGNYSLVVTNACSGTVSPAYANSGFTPPNRHYTSVTNNQVFQNFALIPPPVISGTVRDFETGAGVSNVTLTFGGDLGSLASTTNTDANGAYALTVPYGWTGSVTPSSDSGVFAPTNLVFAVGVTADRAAQDFAWVTSPAISGTVTDARTGAGVAGVLVTFDDGLGTVTTNTDANGDYSMTVPYDWSGTITPSFTNSVFAPTNLSLSRVTFDQPAQNFTRIPQPVISGTVRGFLTGAGMAGVTVTFQGDADFGTSTNTDLNGAYALTVPYGATGTVTPSLANYGFSPSNRTYSAAVTGDQSAQDFAAVPPPRISGTVTRSDTGAPTGGVTITFQDIAGKVFTTNSAADGTYSVVVSNGWSGTVVASPTSGGGFAPTNLVCTDVTLDLPFQDFIWMPPPVISGRVLKTGTSTGVARIALKFSNGGGACTTDANGCYSNQVPYGWSGSIALSVVSSATPLGAFSPATNRYTDVTADLASQNFTWTPLPLIAGRVVKTGTSAGVANVTLTFSNSGGSTITGASGNYTNSVPCGWSGTVTPSTPAGGFFTPASRSYGAVTTNQAAPNFTWTPPVTIAGKVTKSGTTAGVAGVSLTASSGGGTVTTDTNGNYTLTVTNGWSGTVTPASATGGFSPAFRTYGKLTANQTSQSFTWIPPPVISGKVTKTGTSTGVAGVVLTFPGVGTATTIAGGSYSMTVPYNWTGTVTLFCNYGSGVFAPAGKAYSKVIANQTQNYTWSGATHAIASLASPVDGMTIAPMLLPHAAAGAR